MGLSTVKTILIEVIIKILRAGNKYPGKYKLNYTGLDFR